MTNLDIIKKSRDLLDNKWLVSLAAILIVSLISGLPQRLDYKLTFLTVLLQGPMQMGTAVFFLSIARQQETRIESLFEGFSRYIETLIAFVLTAIVVGLGFVLLIVPGIIVAMGLSQTFFIMADDREISAIDAMKKSWEMMKGYKMKFLLLNLIHALMIIVGFILLIVGVFYMLPIIFNSLAVFYDELKNNRLDN